MNISSEDELAARLLITIQAIQTIASAIKYLETSPAADDWMASPENPIDVLKGRLAQLKKQKIDVDLKLERIGIGGFEKNG